MAKYGCTPMIPAALINFQHLKVVMDVMEIITSQ